MTAHGLALAALLGTADYCYREVAEDYMSRPGDLEKMRATTVQWPRKDPFAERWKQMEEREKQKTETQE
jgi:hypothetical protein